MKYQKGITISLGILLLILSFVFNTSFVKYIFSGLGIILLSISFSFKKWKRFGLCVILVLVGSLITDYLLVMNFKRTPVFSIGNTTNDLVSVYNGIWYRLYNCDGKMALDNLYKKDYVCSSDYLEEIDSNVFISHVVENFSDYKNKFVKIKGKISKLEGNKHLDIKAYESSTITVNGYVTFADNVILRFKFKEANDGLNNYEIYDNITLIGNVKSISKDNDVYIIDIEDSVIVNDVLYKDYSIFVTSSELCTLDNNIKKLVEEDTYNIYGSCMDNIFVRYSEDVVYELGFLLTSDKMDISDVLEKAKAVSYQENQVLYEYDGFNIMACKDLKTKYIVGSIGMDFDSGVCE